MMMIILSFLVSVVSVLSTIGISGVLYGLHVRKLADTSLWIKKLLNDNDNN